jgi:regulatory protein
MVTMQTLSLWLAPSRYARLTMRAHTRHELDKALQAKNVPQSVKEAVLDRMQEVGLVDDATFAV